VRADGYGIPWGYMGVNGMVPHLPGFMPRFRRNTATIFIPG
jgi:hypothetical protein